MPISIFRYDKEACIHDVAKLLIDNGIDEHDAIKSGWIAFMHIFRHES